MLPEISEEFVWIGHFEFLFPRWMLDIPSIARLSSPLIPSVRLNKSFEANGANQANGKDKRKNHPSILLYY